MDWVDLVLPLLFLGLPLLGKLLEKSTPTPDHEEGEALEALPPGWDEWPGAEESGDEEGGMHTREAMSLEPVAPEALPLPVLAERPLPAAVVESLEVLEVDREA